ncbi:hypothetical protein [Thermoactinomyces vulgaris]|uniref:hypothetical protein n=1 Tax=Thermoactinomyces vulgaris TaxID=2026 RepID=UPI001586CF81|nr:hypothetical protein [Thermoactinomyces vulgaris]
MKAFNDRGIVKFRIYRKGICCGWLTLEGLVKWMENQKKPTTGKVVSFRKRAK